MKKIFYIVIIAYLCYYSLGTVIDFSLNLNEVTADKASIEIKKPSKMNDEDFINCIEDAATITNTDVVFSTIRQDGDSFFNQYYTTSNNTNFLYNLSSNKEKLFLQNGSIEIKKLFNDMEYIKFSKISELNLEIFNCYVTKESVDEFLTSIQDYGISASKINEAFITEPFITIKNQIYPFCFILFAAVFVILSKRKEAVIKRLTGFRGMDIIKDEFISTSKILLIIFLSIYLIANLVHFIMFPNLINEFALFMTSRILIISVAILALFLLISMLLLLRAKGVDLKGRSQYKNIFISAFAFKSIVIVATIIYLTSALTNLVTTYNTNKTYSFITQKIENYVNVPWNTSRVHVGEDEWGENYEKALNFYELTVDKFNGVIIDTGNYENLGSDKTLYEEYGQNWITVNFNYLNLNPIFNENRKNITEDDLSNKGDVFNLLVPKSMDNEIEDIIQTYVDTFSYKGLKKELVNIIIYDDKKSDIYSYNSFVVTSKNGEIESPIIEIWNKKYLGDNIGNYFGRAYILEVDPPAIAELTPYLEQAGLKDVIINTPLVIDDFSRFLSSLRLELIISLTNIVINLIGLIALVIYIGKVFCEINRKKMAVMRMNGFHFLEIYKNYIIIQIVVNSILIIFSKFVFDINILIGITVSFTELAMFIATAKYYEGKNIIETIKDGD